MLADLQVPVQIYTDALTQPMIAPVQETLTAKQAYAKGAYFIYRSKLYKTTAAIAQDGSIVLEGSGANATPAGTVGDFMKGYKIYTTTIPSDTTGAYGNVTLNSISRNDLILAVYCDSYVVVPRRTSTTWTCIVLGINPFEPIKNTAISDITVVYASTNN